MADDLVIKIKGDTVNVEGAFGRVKKEVKGLDGATKKANTGVAGMKTAWLGATAAIAGATIAFKKITDIPREFEKSIANVSAVTGEAREGLARLARVAGRDTVFSATQASEAMYFLGSAGLRTKDMAEVLMPTLNMAAAAQLGIAEATDMVVGQLKTYEASMSDAEQFTDIMAMTVKSTNTDMRQLGAALGYSAGIAKRVGMDFDELNMVLGTMAEFGGKSEKAGTQLRMAISNLIDPTEKAKKVLDKFGITQDQITEALKDPIELFKLLKPVTEDAADANAVFGVRQGYVISAVNAGLPKLEELKNKMEGVGGTARTMAEKQLDTLDGQLRLVKSAFEELVLSMNESTSMTDTFKEAATDLANILKSEEMLKGINITTQAIATFFQVIITNYRLTVNIFTMMGKFFKEFPFLVWEALGTAKDLWVLFGKTAIDVVKEIGGVVAEVFINIMQRDFEGLKETITGGFKDIAKSADMVAERKKIFSDFKKTFKELSSGIVEDGKDIADTSVDLFKSFEKLFNAITGDAKTLQEEQKKTNEVMKSFGPIIKDSYGEFVSFFDKLKTKFNGFKNTLDNLKKELKSAFEEGLGEGLKLTVKKISEVTEIINAAGDLIGGNFGSALKDFAGLADAMSKGIVSTIAFVLKKIKEAIDRHNRYVQEQRQADLFHMKEIEMAKLDAKLNRLEKEKQAAIDAVMFETAAGRRYTEILSAEEQARYDAMDDSEKEKYDLLQKIKAAELEAEKKYQAEILQVKKDQFNLEKNIKLKEAEMNMYSAIASVDRSWLTNEDEKLIATIQSSYMKLITGIASMQFPGAQAGADFVVPEGYPNDTFMQPVTSGERVTITPADEVSENRGVGGMVIQIKELIVKAANPQEFGMQMRNFATLTARRA